MNILLACQKSGYLRELLRSAGHNALTCDLESPEDGSPYHIQADAVATAYAPGWVAWDCMIAMPECRNLCSSGQHRNDKPGQRTSQQVDDALAFFIALDGAPIKHKILENSIGIIPRRYRKWTQIIHPYYFGDDASKGTCLWATNFPALEFTQFCTPRMICNGCGRNSEWEIDFGQYPVKKQPCLLCHGTRHPRWANQTDSGQNRLGPSPTRSADRARTYPGIARALANAVSRIS